MWSLPGGDGLDRAAPAGAVRRAHVVRAHLGAESVLRVDRPAHVVVAVLVGLLVDVLTGELGGGGRLQVVLHRLAAGLDQRRRRIGTRALARRLAGEDERRQANAG